MQSIPKWPILAVNLPSDVVDNEHANGTPKVTSRHRLESLLACSVPNLHFDRFSVHFFILHSELDAHGVLRARIDCKEKGIVALVGSNKIAIKN